MEARHDALRYFGADTKEGLEGVLRNGQRLAVGDGIGKSTFTSVASVKLIPDMKGYNCISTAQYHPIAYMIPYHDVCVVTGCAPVARVDRRLESLEAVPHQGYETGRR